MRIRESVHWRLRSRADTHGIVLAVAMTDSALWGPRPSEKIPVMGVLVSSRFMHRGLSGHIGALIVTCQKAFRVATNPEKSNRAQYDETPCRLLKRVRKWTPSNFRRTGTEWLHRLLCEPKPWRRQLVLPKFAHRVCCAKMASINKGQLGYR